MNKKQKKARTIFLSLPLIGMDPTPMMDRQQHNKTNNLRDQELECMRPIVCKISNARGRSHLCDGNFLNEKINLMKSTFNQNRN